MESRNHESDLIIRSEYREFLGLRRGGKVALLVVVGVLGVIGIGVVIWSVVLAVLGTRGAPIQADTERGTPDSVGAYWWAPLVPEVLSVTDAVARDSIWLVLDALGHQVHRISPKKGLLGSFGREGSGPGEFGHTVAIVAHGDSVVVVGNEILHLFTPTGEHITDRHVRVSSDLDCLGGRTADAVSLRIGLILLVHCYKRDGSLAQHAVIETADGFLRSLARYESRPGVIDWSSISTVLESHERGFLFGSPYDNCLRVISPSGQRLDEVCHEWLRRAPVPDRFERRMNELKKRAAQIGLRVQVPDLSPPFVGVSVTDVDQIVYHVVLSKEVELGTLGLVTLGAAREVVSLRVPQAQVLFLHDSLLLVARHELEGVRIAFGTLDPGLEDLHMIRTTDASFGDQDANADGSGKAGREAAETEGRTSGASNTIQKRGSRR